MYRETTLLCLAVGLTMPAFGASQDNNVEWAGLSHIGFQDRSPLMPMNGQSFTVRFQSYRNDLTAASVKWNDGSARSAPALVVASAGAYDIWQATLPATTSSALSYFIEVIDGVDTDYLGPDGVSDSVPADGWSLDYVTLEHAPFGSTPVVGGAVFKVWAPSRSTCHVRGEFNNWSTANPLTKYGQYFIGFVPGAEPGHMYKYYFNGAIWKPDARGLRFNPVDNYNSHIIDRTSYTWQSDLFEPAPLEELVIYQLHVGTFAGRNDPAGPTQNPSGYRDVADRVDHLAELGINAVMLNPITEFPGDFSGGYNPITAFAPESKYGSVDDLKYLVDELHGRGISVLLDIVWNHFSVTDNFLWEYDGTQIYFDTPYVDTPWGAQADLGGPEVRSYYLDSVVSWLDDFRMDGFRMDATSYMDIQPGGWSLMQEMNDLIDNRYVGKIAIAEQLPDNDWITRPTSIGGAGFDSQYWDRYTDDLRAEIFDAAFGNPEMWKIRNIINGGGTYLSNGRVTNYFELHDEAWTSSGGQRAVKIIDNTFPHDSEYAKGRTKLAQGIVLTSPGVPAMLMGTEWLEDAGFETEKIDWSKKTTYAGIFRYYQDMIALRTGERALLADAGRNVYHVNEGGNVIAWERWGDDGTSFVMVANFSNTDFPSYTLGMPRPGTWGVEINSEAAIYEGDGFGTSGTFTTEAVGQDGMAQRATIAVPGHGIMVLRHNPTPGGCNAADIAEPFGVLDLTDISTFASGFLSQDPTADIDGNGVWDLADINSFVAAFLAGCP